MSSNLRLVCLYVFTALASVLVAAPAFAQYASGIEGAVLDQTGAVVPGAQCSVVNQETQVEQTVTSDAQGYVRILHLAPGKYRIAITAPGFEKWVQSNVLVEGGAHRAIYPTLKVGQNSSTVEVRAETESLETTQGTVSRTLENQTVAAAPLVGGSLYASVATLAPGVTGLGDASGSISSAGSQGTNSFNSEAGFQINAAGQHQDTNEFQVDGTNVMSTSRDGVVNISPEADTVSEMKISSSTFSAEKGRQSGALIEVFTKPGTNQFHGSLSEVHSDAAMSAHTWFETAVPHSLRNDFGGTIGGPIFKDRTFFFGSLFWMRSLNGNTFDENVETKDFEDYVKQNYPDSMAAKFFTAAPPRAFPTTNFYTVADVNAQWPSPFFTPPNIPDTLVASGQMISSTSAPDNGFQGHIRIDHNLRGDTDKLFYSLFRNTTQAMSANARPALSYTSPNATIYNKLDYVHTFSPSLVNEASLSFTRVSGFQPDRISSLPTIGGIGGIDASFWQWGPSGWAQNNWFVHDTLNYTRGTHAFRVGVDVDRQQDFDDFENGDVRPNFAMINLLDMAADHPYYQSGPVMNPKTGRVATNLYQRVLLFYFAPYVQDDWKVNRRFTINAGLRLDYFGHLSTLENGHSPISFFTPGSGSTFADQVGNGSMVVRGSNGIATTDAKYRIAPRIGFAWDVFGNGNTAVHGGYGFFNNKLGEYAYMNNMRTNPPDDVDPSINMYNSGTTLANFSYGTSSSGAQGFAPPPGITFEIDAHGGIVGTRIGVGGIDPKMNMPLVHSWALGVQQKIAGFAVEADYFGTAGRDLFLQTDVNRFAGDEIVNGGNLNLLNSSFGSVTYGRSLGVSNTEEAAFGISRHFSKGWTVHAIYTFGKSLDLTSNNDNGVNGDGSAEGVFDAQTLAGNYGRSDYDSRHRLSVDAVWNLPGLRSGFGKTLTQGWTLSPVIILQSGQPFTVYTSAQYNQGGDYNADGFDYDVPNKPSFGSHISTSRSDFLNTNGVFWKHGTALDPTAVGAFTAPTAGTEGNLGRNTYDGPGFANVNLSAERSFTLPHLGKEGKLEIRGEIMNLFNRVNLTNPVSDMSNTLFGQSTGQDVPRYVQVSAHIRF